MENPWLSLPGAPPFVLAEDQPAIDRFNRKHSDDIRRLLRLDIRPEPYIGSLGAPIVMLYLNPGYTADDLLLHDHPDGEALWSGNVHQTLEDYPFYMLDPRIAWAPGSRWWRKTLSKLIAVASERTISRSILVVEYFPYHSMKDPRFPGTVPSQEFSFHLVDQAVNRGALILITRSGRAWRERVPSLNDYPLAYEARSPQQSMISQGNFPEAFSHVIEILNIAMADQ